MSRSQRFFAVRLTEWTVAFVALAIPFGLLLWQVVSQGPVTRWDQSFAELLHRHVHRGAEVTTLRAVTTLGNPWVLALAVGAGAGALYVTRRWRLLTFLVVTAAAGGAVNAVVKVVVGRDRPVLDDPVAVAGGKSFTSGHAMTSLVCYGALLVVFLPMAPARARPWLGAAYVLLVAAIGFSRLALGVHFLSDVVGGWALGVGWLAGCVAVFRLGRRTS